jgi:hypothetical protein
MPNTKTAPAKQLPLGKPRATKYLEIIAKRDGKRKAAAVEKRAREIAAQQDPPAKVVRFEFVAEAAGITLEQMAEELREHGISTSPSNVKHGTLQARTPGKTRTSTKTAAKTAAKDGPGNARKATTRKATSPSGAPAKSSTSKASSSSRPAKPDPKSGTKTGGGSRKRSASSRTPAGSRGRTAGSSHSKSAQMRQLREKQASKL